MSAARLTLGMIKHEVALDYPGAKGVVFNDAVFAVRNQGDESASAIWLKLRITQGDSLLFEGSVDPKALGKAGELEPGGEESISLFRILQNKVPGFGSRVNLFGYKAVLDWTYKVTAEIEAEKVPTPPPVSWSVCWSPSEADTNLVGVEILPE